MRRQPPDTVALAYAYLNRRERTVAELRSRLEQAECPPEQAAGVIEELVGFGYLDDARYARLFVEDKRALAGWGAARIERDLRERGVDPELIAAALAGAGDSKETELDRATALLQQRYPVRSEDPRERERAFAMLVRKGYDSELAGDAVRAWRRAE